MRQHRFPKSSRFLFACLILVGSLTALRIVAAGRPAAAPIPARLTDEQFWKLSTGASEQDGTFRSDNLANLAAIVDQLKMKHGFPLSEGDVEGIQWALRNYYRYGPSINYNSSSATTAPAVVGAAAFGGRRNGGFGGVTYADLMMADDGDGQARSYLATEENFAFLKDLESKNLLVPVVVDFGGPKAIRDVGKYLKSIDAMVSAWVQNSENVE